MATDWKKTWNQVKDGTKAAVGGAKTIATGAVDDVKERLAQAAAEREIKRLMAIKTPDLKGEDQRTLINNIEHPGVDAQREMVAQMPGPPVVKNFNGEIPRVERIARENLHMTTSPADSRSALAAAEHAGTAEQRVRAHASNAEAVALAGAQAATEKARVSSMDALRQAERGIAGGETPVAEAQTGDRGVITSSFQRHASMSDASRKAALEFIRSKGLDAPVLAEAVGDRGGTIIAASQGNAHLKPMVPSEP